MQAEVQAGCRQRCRLDTTDCASKFLPEAADQELLFPPAQEAPGALQWPRPVLLPSRGCVPPAPPCPDSSFTSFHWMIIFCSCWEAPWGPELPGVPRSCLTHLAGPSGPRGQSGLTLQPDQGWGAATTVGDTASAITAPAWSPHGSSLGERGHSRSPWPGTHSSPSVDDPACVPGTP